MDLNQVTVPCADLAASTRFYTPVAGPAFAAGSNGGPGSDRFAYPLDPARDSAFPSQPDRESCSPLEQLRDR